MSPIARLTLLSVAFFLAPTAQALPVESGYLEPGQDIIDLVDMAPPVSASLAPDGQTLLILELPSLPVLADLAAPELRLAGIRFNPSNHAPSNPRYFSAMVLKSLAGEERSIRGLPEPLRVLDSQWSPDGASIAFLQIEDEQVELWRVDVASAQARRWSDRAVHAAWGRGWGPFARSYMDWASDSQAVVFRTLPADRGSAPEQEMLPSGPVITETRGRSAPTRTFQDLLGNVHDERLFEFHFTTQLVRVELEGTTRELGPADLIPSFSLSPDGRHLLLMRLSTPYSYAVPFSRFAHVIEVWSRDGEFEHQLATNPLADDLPIAFDAVISGRRSVSWRADADATLVWAQAADGGDPAFESDVRDRLFQQASPFDDEPELILETPYRVSWIVAGDGQTALVWQRWWATRTERVSRVSPDQPARDAHLVWERAYEDRYADPGVPATRRDERGQNRLLMDQDFIFLLGQGASDEGNRPFIDRFELVTGNTQRLWQSEPPYFEQVVDVLDPDVGLILTRRESIDQPPDFFTRDLVNGQLNPITQTEHPLPEIKDIHRELITYQREDGITLSATLLLPPGYDAQRDGPLPTVVWAYPREFLRADAAGQLTDSPYRFNRLSYWSAQFLATQGYAVFDNATMPVVGAEDIEPNDRFIEQISMNARAVIEAGVARGVTDPDRVAIGGHSYGAFMTASLLAHTDLFRAGIARSGAYNRTLTPFGFQSEQRTLWDDTELYVNVSPFFHVHRIKAPILIIHGAEDNNSGTYPMQSERLYQAIRGLGGTARLVMLPLESHGYRARESVLHMLHETVNWLNEHLAE
jgi:dipeptidyl aminopeptidase/acylaminoacyl peptidase